jgi:hypothetical protein
MTAQDEDMSAYLKSADTFHHEFVCCVIIIHHRGINHERPRAHTSQTGAADVQISVKMDAGGTMIATAELAPDTVEGTTFVSRLEVVELGIDQDRDLITSCSLRLTP